jgi:hypothetical protein
MRFALIGDHPDGTEFASAMRDAGHTLARSTGLVQDGEVIEEILSPAVAEVLADPQIQAVIVAVRVDKRLDVTRRVLQSERHALVVHPVDVKPDGGYELNMLQGDMHQVLLPLLSEAFVDAQLLPGAWLELTVTDPSEPLLYLDATRRHPAFPGWTLIRRAAGEVLEVSTFGMEDFAQPGGVLLCSGRAERGLFHIKCHRGGERRQVNSKFVTSNGEIQIDLSGAANAWPRLVAEFDRAVARLAQTPRSDPGVGATEEPGARIAWRDEIRALELNNAAARSLAKRRSVLMEYQEASEEVGFKGTMTLIGCGMIWVIILMLILSVWLPWLQSLILPALVLFLGMQLFGIFARRR